MEAEKDGEPEEEKDGSLAEVNAKKRGGKAEAEPVEIAACGAEELPENPDGGDEEA